MKKNKKIAGIISVIIMTVSLSGCSLLPDGSLTMEKKEASDIVIENNHVQGTLVEGVSVDANVTGTDTGSWHEYEAVLRTFDEGQAGETAKTIMGEDVQLKSVYANAESGDGTDAYSYENSQEMSANIRTGIIYMMSQKFVKMQYSTFYSPSGVILSDEELQELFPKESIEGLDKETLLNQFKEKCKSLDLNISNHVKVYALDLESANKIRNENEWVSLDKYGNKMPDWAEEDEAYVFLAPVQIADTELPMRSASSKTGYAQESYVAAVIGRNGMCHFSAAGLYEMKEGKMVENVHTLQDVLDYLATSYSYLSDMNQATTFTDINLRYVVRYYELDKTYKVVPAWVCKKETKVITGKDGEDTESMRTEYIYIDAQTMASFVG